MQSPQFRSSERGQVIVLLMLMIVGLMGITALAVDGGRLYYSQRTAQNASDNAALAAALAMCTSGNVNTAAISAANDNGFNNDGVSNTVTVNHPPASGPNAGDNEYVEVVINSQEQPAFAQIVYSGVFETTTRAVAHCYSSGSGASNPNGLIALADTGDCAVDLNGGSGAVQVNDGGVFINSTGNAALCIDGGSTGPGGVPRIEADWIDIVGDYSIPSWMTPAAMVPNPPNTGVADITDPLADVEPPDPPTQPGGAPPPNVGGCTSKTPLSGGHLNISRGYAWCTSQVVVYPGSYNSMTFSADVEVIMQPGLYYISGGNLSITGPSSNHVNGTSGVTFYLDSGNVVIDGSARATLTAPSSGLLMHLGTGDIAVGGNSTASPITLTGMIYLGEGAPTVTGSGIVNLSPPASGIYAGLSMFMDRSNDSTYTVSGDGNLNAIGTVYLPAAHVLVTGSGESFTFSGQIIAWDYDVPGAALLGVTYDPDVSYGSGASVATVELSE